MSRITIHNSSTCPQNLQAVTSDSSINKTIIQHIINATEALELAKRVAGQNATLVDYSLRPYSNKHLGYYGSHLQLLLDAKKSGVVETHSFFVKTVPYDNPIQAASIKRVFEKETIFFQEVVPSLPRNGNVEPWTPECYLVKNDTLGKCLM